MKNVIKKLVDFLRFIGFRYLMVFTVCIAIVIFVFDPPEVLYGFLLAINLMLFGCMFYFAELITTQVRRLDKIEQQLNALSKKVTDAVSDDGGE